MQLNLFESKPDTNDLKCYKKRLFVTLELRRTRYVVRRHVI